jgi:tetratricopeptide (TPR) repeat protein
LSAQTVNGSPRVIVDFEDSVSSVTAEAEFLSSVVIIRFDTPMTADASELASEIGPEAAMARLDPDGMALRIAMRRDTVPRISTSYDVVAIDLLRPGQTPPPSVVSPRERREREAAQVAAAAPPAPPPPPADPLPVIIRTGQAAEYTRLEIEWPRPVGYQLTQDGDRAFIRFDAPADVDLSRLDGSPPRFLEGASGEREGDEYVLTLELGPAVSVRAWEDANRVIVDLLDPATSGLAGVVAALEELAPPVEEDPVEEETVETADAEAVAEVDLAEGPIRLVPDAAPAAPVDYGVIEVSAAESNGDLRAVFDWPDAVGAAVFRRGEAIWIVFDAEADLDLESFNATRRNHVRGFQAVRGEGFSAARVVAAPSSQAEARADGSRWTVAFSERIESPARPITVHREASHGGPGRVHLGLAGANQVLDVPDPVVGDVLNVVTARSPVQGLGARRDFIGAVLLPSAHGAAVERLADDLLVTLTPSGGALIERPGGLALTPAGTEAMTLAADPGVRKASPAFMDFAAWEGSDRFSEQWPALLRRASADESPDGRLAMARYALASGLAPEALGMAREAIAINPQLAEDANVRTLQGVASHMMGRTEEAEEFLSDPALMTDPAAAPWRALVAMESERWAEARRLLEEGREVIYHFRPDWRARFRIAHARAALELGDIGAADQSLRLAARDAPDELAQADADMIAARLAAANGDTERAIATLEGLAASDFEPVAVRALSALYQLRLDNGEMSAEEGVEALESLRFRWRGDAVELETVSTLGRLYIREGAYAEGLDILQSARIRYPESQTARRIAQEMQDTFRQLFLEGSADRLDPIEAVALFYQYADLTPVGAEGDRMIRRLADRLIAFDLLGPAAELLDHQVENRLREPTARARVATDLAVVMLMDRRYEDALRTLRASRIRGLPDELVRERYVLEARAYAELGRHDQALDLIRNDRTPAASRLRADIAWEQRDWSQSGRRLEAILGDRWEESAPLRSSEVGDLLRAAIAYSLAGDRAGSRRLAERYGTLMADSDQAQAFSVLTNENVTPGDVRIRDLANRIADIDTLSAFMDEFRGRFSGEAS